MVKASLYRIIPISILRKQASKQETTIMQNDQSSQDEINSDQENLPLFSVLNSNSGGGGGGGALLDGVTLPSSDNFYANITFTSSDPLSASDYPQPPYSYYSLHNNHQLQISRR